MQELPDQLRSPEFSTGDHCHARLDFFGLVEDLINLSDCLRIVQVREGHLEDLTYDISVS